MARVCEIISTGKLVKDAAAETGVSLNNIYEWGLLPEFSQDYTRARVSQAHALAEGALSIADGTDEDATARIEAMASAVDGVDDEDKERILNALAANAVQRDRVRVETRKWFTSKIAPKIYGEKITTEHEGKIEHEHKGSITWGKTEVPL